MATETQPQQVRRRWWLWIIGGVVLVIAVLAISFVSWALAVDAMPEAQEALTNDDSVTITTENWLAFTPAR